MADVPYEPVQKALEVLKRLSADEETRRLAFVRERAAWDEATLLKEAEERGEQRGEQRGEGILLQRQLTRRFGALPNELVERIALASKDEIELWGGRILDAATLNDVFQD